MPRPGFRLILKTAWHEYLMADGLYGELQTALAMEDNSDDLRWLVCATSLLLNEDSLATSQNAFLTLASSNWGSMQSLDLPSTPFLRASPSRIPNANRNGICTSHSNRRSQM